MLFLFLQFQDSSHQTPFINSINLLSPTPFLPILFLLHFSYIQLCLFFYDSSTNISLIPIFHLVFGSVFPFHLYDSTSWLTIHSPSYLDFNYVNQISLRGALKRLSFNSSLPDQTPHFFKSHFLLFSCLILLPYIPSLIHSLILCRSLSAYTGWALCERGVRGEVTKINQDPGSILKENEISTTIEGSEKLWEFRGGD